jgi:hypothetical protein
MPKKNDRVEFENGRDVLRGTIVGKHIDPNRPDMEETWTVFADTVMVNGEPIVLVDADGVQACDLSGAALHKNWGGVEPLQLVKHGVPVPFRVRARRMTVL